MSKNQKQPYYWFMVDFKEKEKQKGMHYSLAQAADRCGEAWRALGAEERRPFQEKAKRAKEGFRLGSTGPTFTTRGYAGPESNETRPHLRPQPLSESRSLQSMAADEVDQNEREQYLENLVEAVVGNKQSVDETYLKSKSFFIISFNVMVKTLGGVYYPNEVGIVEYSMDEGIIREFHDFIDPGLLPQGYAGEAMDHEKIHRIPVFDFSEAKKPFSPQVMRELLEDIIEFIGEKSRFNDGNDRILHLLYSLPDQREQIKGCLDYIAREAETPNYEELVGRIEVLDVIKLLFAACKRKEEVRPYAECERDLTRSMFDYSPNTLCAYHLEKDCIYCALGLPKRLCYMLSDVLCNSYGVEATDRHLPDKENDSFSIQTFEPEQNMRRPHFIVPFPEYDPRGSETDGESVASSSFRKPASLPPNLVRSRVPAPLPMPAGAGQYASSVSSQGSVSSRRRMLGIGRGLSPAGSQL